MCILCNEAQRTENIKGFYYKQSDINRHAFLVKTCVSTGLYLDTIPLNAFHARYSEACPPPSSETYKVAFDMRVNMWRRGGGAKEQCRCLCTQIRASSQLVHQHMPLLFSCAFFAKHLYSPFACTPPPHSLKLKMDFTRFQIRTTSTLHFSPHKGKLDFKVDNICQTHRFSYNNGSKRIIAMQSNKFLYVPHSIKLLVAN